MAEVQSSRRWPLTLTFLAIAVVILFGRLLPLTSIPRSFALPDLLLAVTIAWSVRRPETLPVILLAGVFLLADLLLHRPPGLYAALVVLASEALRRRSRQMRDLPFTGEWLTVALAILGITFGGRLIMALTFVPVPQLTLTLSQMVGTIVVYPLVVFVLYLGFGLRRAAPGEVDTLGHRL